jgi:uncharacterized membrane protein (GlpM family)
MDMIWKGIAGLSRRSDGILPLSPAIALIALLIVGAKGDGAGFREACLAGAKTIPTYLAFLAVCDFAIGPRRLPLGPDRRASRLVRHRAWHLPGPRWT